MYTCSMLKGYSQSEGRSVEPTVDELARTPEPLRGVEVVARDDHAGRVFIDGEIGECWINNVDLCVEVFVRDLAAPGLRLRGISHVKLV